MKRLLGTAALLLACGTAMAQPSVYGRIDLRGGYPTPQVLYPDAVYIQRGPGVAPPPLYLHVPPSHSRRWSTYCGRYNACGAPVYFVQDNWYRDVYTPQYQNYQRRPHAQNEPPVPGDRFDRRNYDGFGNRR